MKIQIFSDVHNGINEIDPKDILSDDADLYLDAGDTGEAEYTVDFYKNDFWKNKQVAFVAGNHTFYNHLYPETNRWFNQNFKNSKRANITYLNNRYKIFGDVVIIGSTLWTDFKLFNNEATCKETAKTALNDYYYIQITNRLLFTPDYSANLFKTSMEYIKRITKKYKNKKVVILTHHAPSIQSCLDIYKDDLESACFASNLENFIKCNPNIVAWVHGHVHNHNDYMIGTTRVISNPVGYATYNEESNYQPTFLEI